MLQVLYFTKHHVKILKNQSIVNRTFTNESHVQDNPVMKRYHIEIAPMKPDELTEVCKIENASFGDPWSEQLFLNALESPMTRCYVARVREQGVKGIAAYLVYWIVAGEVHLHRIAVVENLRRKGIATALIMGMIKESLREGAKKCILEVANSNESAKKLYEKLGFSQEGLRKRYYNESGDDALVMTIDLRKWETTLFKKNDGCKGNFK